ncbi:MAG: Gfo/Idh/MocA family oxidoreductase [Planctomycetota bacterium]|nr:Gfo/Idh/MocA family oxidoreductase [Planctomycetota bacterium]
MPASPVRFGLIGCGEIAMHSVKALQGLSESCAIAAVQDVVEGLAKDTGERLGVPAVTQVDALLARNDVDAVVLSTPHFLHAPLAIQAAKAGKHVACEKPIACTLAQADEMIAACHAAGVKLSINYISRYSGMVRKAKELVEAGAIGKILRYQVHVAADKPESYWSGGYTGRAKSDWRQSKEKSGGGVLVMNLSHNLDFVLWLTGLVPERVYAEAATHLTPVEVEDNISAVVHFRGGAIGSIDAMSCARGKESFGDRLYGSEGQLVLASPLRVYTAREGVPGLTKGQWTDVDVGKGLYGTDERGAYFADFAKAIREDTTPLISGEEARKALALCVAIYQSAETHEPVKVDHR